MILHANMCTLFFTLAKKKRIEWSERKNMNEAKKRRRTETQILEVLAAWKNSFFTWFFFGSHKQNRKSFFFSFFFRLRVQEVMSF